MKSGIEHMIFQLIGIQKFVRTGFFFLQIGGGIAVRFFNAWFLLYQDMGNA
jgi:hypothetical protein